MDWATAFMIVGVTWAAAVVLIVMLSSDEDALQAKIDLLMWEYCPDAMTEEQVEKWGRHQKAYKPSASDPLGQKPATLNSSKSPLRRNDHAVKPQLRT